MGRSLLIFALLSAVTVLLFVPISLKIIAHYDMNRKKFCFVVYLFSVLKIIGGYIATYQGGFAVHITRKKAFLLPYSQINKERKRFSFIRTFQLRAFHITTETGAEYLLPLAWIYTLLNIYFFAKGGNKGKIKNNILLSDGDVLRVSASFLMRFTLLTILKNTFIIIKEKVKALWLKNMKKSTT